MSRWWLALAVTAALSGCEKVPEPEPTPSQVETTPPDAPDVSVPPEPPSQQSPRIIERERITERDNDDNDRAPDVRIVTPPQSAPTSQPPAPTPAQTTRPPIIRDIPELPAVPEVEVPDLPLDDLLP